MGTVWGSSSTRMAENEEMSKVLKVESSLEQINESIERIHISNTSIAKNEEESVVPKVESSAEQINEDLERIYISFGSSTSIAENEEKSSAPKVESSTEQISKYLEGKHKHSRYLRYLQDKVAIYGNPRMAIPWMSQPCQVSSANLREEEIRGNPCKEEQEGDKLTRTFSQQWIDVGTHSFNGRCFKVVSIITYKTCCKHNSHLNVNRNQFLICWTSPRVLQLDFDGDFSLLTPNIELSKAFCFNEAIVQVQTTKLEVFGENQVSMKFTFKSPSLEIRAPVLNDRFVACQLLHLHGACVVIGNVIMGDFFLPTNKSPWSPWRILEEKKLSAVTWLLEVAICRIIFQYYCIHYLLPATSQKHLINIIKLWYELFGGYFCKSELRSSKW